MNTQTLLTSIAALAYVPLLFLLIGSRPWQRRSTYLLAFLIPAALWSLGTAVFRSPLLLDYKLLIGRTVLGLLVLTGVQLHYFLHYSYSQRTLRFPLAYVPGFLVLALLVTNVPESVRITGSNIEPVYGIWVAPALIYIYVLLGRDVHLLWRMHRILPNPMGRNQASYLMLGTIIMLTFVSASLTPIGADFPVAHFGNLMNAAILTYVTIKYELVSMRFVVRRLLGYSAAGFLIGFPFFAILYLFHYGLGLPLNFLAILNSALVSAVILVLSWYPLQRYLAPQMDRIFYGDRLSYRIEAYDFSKHAQSILEVEGIGKRLTRTVVGAIGAHSARLFVKKGGGEDFVISFAFPEDEKDMEGLVFRKDSPVVQWLTKNRRYMSANDLNILPELTGLWERERKALEMAKIEFFWPLMARDRLVAILTVSKGKAPYDVEDMNLLQVLSNQASVIIDNARLFMESKDLTSNLQLINRLTEIVISSLDIKEVYDKFVQELRRVMDADWASVALPEGEHVRLFAISAIADSVWKWGETIPLEGTGLAYLMKFGKSFVERDLLKEHKFWTGDVHLQQGIRSLVYVPLVTRGEIIGALILGSRRPDAYAGEHIALLEQVSGQLAAAVENFRLYSRVQGEAIGDDLTGLFNRRYFEERLNEEIDRHSRYGGVFTVVIADLDFFKAYNDTYGHRAGDRILSEVGKIMMESVRKVDLCFRYGGDEFVLLLPQTSIEEGYRVSERVRERVASDLKALKSTISISLGIASWPSDGATPDDIVRAADAALYYAKQTGGDRTCLFSKIVPFPGEEMVRAANSERIALDTVHALGATVDAKDHYTYHHSRRVAAYAIALAEAAGLSQDQVVVLKTAALLHDVGKIGVPDSILNKPGKLTADEWATIKSHSSLGATIVSYVPSLARCFLAILYHHEHYDGQGYPKSLRGDDIPVEARILAIADAFAAMTSNRPYRDALSTKEAIDRLRQSAGKQFDAALVDRFVSIALSLFAEEAGADDSA